MADNHDWLEDMRLMEELHSYEKESGSQSSSNPGCSNAGLLLILYILGVLWLLGKLSEVGMPTWVALVLLIPAAIPLIYILNMKS